MSTSNTTLGAGMSDEEQYRIGRACNPIEAFPKAACSPKRLRDLQSLERRLISIAAALHTFGMVGAAITLDEATREVQHLIDHRDSPADAIMRGPA